MTTSHDTPKASAIPAMFAANNDKVAPKKLKLSRIHAPNMLPTTPPALCRKTPGGDGNAAIAQLAASSNTKPPARTNVSRAGRFLGLAGAEHEAGRAEHRGEQRRREAEQEQQRVGEPSALAADRITDFGAVFAREGEAGVARVVADERHGEREREHTDGDHRSFAQAAQHGAGETGIDLCGGVGQAA
jgi:hypothetical protein